jgi:ABC-2 type transport system permease protein
VKPCPLLALARKELFSSFISPVFYGTGAFFLFFLSFWLYYFRAFFALDTASLRIFFSAFPFVYILVIPAITMKSWAEEKNWETRNCFLPCPFPNGIFAWGNSFHLALCF